MGDHMTMEAAEFEKEKAALIDSLEQQKQKTASLQQKVSEEKRDLEKRWTTEKNELERSFAIEKMEMMARLQEDFEAELRRAKNNTGGGGRGQSAADAKQLEKLQAENRKLVNQISNLEKSLRDQSQTYVQELELINGDCAALKKKMEAATAEIELKAKAVEEQQAKSVSAAAELQKFKADNDQKLQLLQSQQSTQIADFQRKCDGLQQELSAKQQSYEQINTSMRAEVDRLNAAIERSQAESELLRSELQNSKTLLRDAEATRQDLESSLKSTTTNQQRLTAELHRIREEYSFTSQRSASLADEVLQLKAELSQSRDAVELAESSRELEDVQWKAGMKSEQAKLSAALQQLQLDLKIKEETVISLEEEVAEVKRHLASEKENSKSLNSRLEAQQHSSAQDCQRLESDLAAAKQQLTNVTSQLQSSTLNVRDFEAESRQLKEDVERISAQMVSEIEQRLTAERTWRAAEESLRAATVLQEQATSGQQLLQQRNVELQQLYGAKEDLLHEREELKQRIEELDTALKTVELDRDKLQREQEELLVKQAGINEEIQAQLTASQSELKAIQSELTTSQSELKASQGKLEASKAEVNQLERLKADLNKQLDTVKREFEDLAAAFQKSTETVSQLELENIRLQDDNVQLKKQTVTADPQPELEKEIARLRHEKSDLKQESQQLSQRLQEAVQSHHEVSNTVTLLQVENLKIQEQLKAALAASAEAHIEALKVQKTQKANELEELETRLTQAAQEMEELKICLAEMGTRLTFANDNLGKSQSDNATLKAELANEKQELERANSKLADQENELQRSNLELVNQMKQLERAKIELTNQKAELEKTNSALSCLEANQQISQLSMQSNASDVETVASIADDLVMQLEEVSGQLRQHQEENNLLKTENSQLHVLCQQYEKDLVEKIKLKQSRKTSGGSGAISSPSIEIIDFPSGDRSIGTPLDNSNGHGGSPANSEYTFTHIEAEGKRDDGHCPRCSELEAQIRELQTTMTTAGAPDQSTSWIDFTGLDNPLFDLDKNEPQTKIRGQSLIEMADSEESSNSLRQFSDNTQCRDRPRSHSTIELQPHQRYFSDVERVLRTSLTGLKEDNDLLRSRLTETQELVKEQVQKLQDQMKMNIASSDLLQKLYTENYILRHRARNNADGTVAANNSNLNNKSDHVTFSSDSDCLISSNMLLHQREWERVRKGLQEISLCLSHHLRS